MAVLEGAYGSCNDGNPYRREGFQQSRHANDVQHPLEIVGEHRQAELPAHLPQAFQQEVALIHPPLHRAEGMLAEHLPLREHLGRAPEVCFHGFQEVLIHPPRDLAPVLVPRAAHPERTAPTGARAVVLDGVASPADLLTGDPQ